MKHILFFIGILFFVHCGFSQHDHVEEEKYPIFLPYHKITIITANSIITNNATENSDGVFVIPTFGLNYDYFFKQKWGIGLHTDIVLQQYKIERHHDERELVRQNPVALCGVVSHKPHHRWMIIGGYGIELERHENISLFRFGIEYGIELKDDWELALGLDYDHKFSTYSSFMFGVGFSKILGKH